MLLGIVYSFKRVFDPIIVEEKRRLNEVSGEILMQAEHLISNKENSNNLSASYRDKTIEEI